MKASIGRIVQYTLTEQDAIEINRRRTHGGKIAEQIKEGKWSIGAQAHIGNEAKAGQVYPMIIIVAWNETLVNGQVFLDGNDTFWATSKDHGTGEGYWNWPVIEK